MSGTISRNQPCPCGSGRKFKRCCKDAVDNPALLAEQHDAVGSRIRAWASEHHDEQMRAGFGEIVAGYEGIVLGGVDLQLIETWVIGDRELPDGGTIAQRFIRRSDISGEQRDVAQRIATARLALLRVDRVVPSRSIRVHDVSRDEMVIVSSHGVSNSVKPGDVIVTRIMAGPPAPSLWGPVGFLSGQSAREFRKLIMAQIGSLDLQDEPSSLAIAMQAASREITTLLAPAFSRARQGQLAASA